jgi:hypothetical protein
VNHRSPEAQDLEAEPETTRPVTGWRVLVAVVLALAAALGYFLGHDSDGTESNPATSENIRSDGFTLRVPGKWRRPNRRVAFLGLDLESRIERSPPSGGRRSALIVGIARAEGRSPLSAEVWRRAGVLVPDAAVRLGALEALRYRDLAALEEVVPVELFATPVRDGVLVAACVGRRRGFLRSCEAALGTLTLARGGHYDFGADHNLVAALGASMARLIAARGRGAARMWQARDAAGQASAARSVAEAYLTDADLLARGGDGPASARTRRAIVLAMQDAATAWRALGVAAESGDFRRYERGTRAVTSSENALRAVVAQAFAFPDGGAASEPPPVPPTPSDSQPCSSTLVDDVAGDEGVRPYVRLCTNRARTSMLAENISSVVIVLTFNAHPSTTTHVTPPPPSFTNAVVQNFVPSTCQGASCHLAPGSSVRLDSDVRLEVDFRLALEDTGAVLFSRAAASMVESRLTAPPLRRARLLADCATDAAASFEDRPWEERFRNAVMSAEKCNSLRKEVFGATPAKRQRTWQQLVGKIHSLSGGADLDAMLLAMKTAQRVIR